jgi:hypothetical protein
MLCHRGKMPRVDLKRGMIDGIVEAGMADGMVIVTTGSFFEMIV